MKKTKLHGIFFEPPIFTIYLGEQMAEVFKEVVYGQLTHGKKDLTILDVGANVGVTTYYFQHFAKMVYSLEPAEEHFNALKKMIEFNELKNVTPINKALYIKSGKMPFFKYSNRTSYSLFNLGEGTPSVMVDCITLKDLFKEYKIEKIDIMKMDIEGNEYDILCSTDFRELSKKIKAVVFETHNWSGRNPNQIKDALTKNGYEMKELNSGAESKLFCGIRYDI